MSSEIVVLVFDIIILILGINTLLSALRMKKTGIPSAILIPKEEQARIRNQKAFCEKIFQPTLLFGILICVYGVADLCNSFVVRVPYMDIACIACFLLVCAWYMKKLRDAKDAHM